MKPEQLDQLVYYQYNMKLIDKNRKERILRKDQEFDYLDLYLSNDNDEAPFDWIECVDTDESELDEDGQPNNYIAKRMSIDISRHLVRKPKPEDIFDVSEPDIGSLVPSVASDNDDETGPSVHVHDVYDDASTSGGGGVETSVNLDDDDAHATIYELAPRGNQQGLHFTGESNFQFATQDTNHGVRPSSRSRIRRNAPYLETGSSRHGPESSTSGRRLRQDEHLLGPPEWNYDGYYSSVKITQSSSDTQNDRWNRNVPRPHYSSVPGHYVYQPEQYDYQPQHVYYQPQHVYYQPQHGYQP